jgi:hypothetical protein
MIWTGHAARMAEMKNAYIVLVGKSEGKIPPGRPERRWEYYIKIYHKTGCKDVD